jgi:antibiotic biosynthesis monooxygenase (ABM) superfamily enzyme
MVIIFMGFFPLSLAVNYLVGHTALAEWPLVLRVLATIVVMTPLMTYVVLPWLTRRMSWWLHR